MQPNHQSQNIVSVSGPARVDGSVDYLNNLNHGIISLGDVPEQLRTAEMCRISILNNQSAIQHLPRHLLTPELCILAVEHDGCELEHIPDDFRSHELCMIAVDRDGCALEHVPRHLQSRELCMTAIRETIEAIRYIPENLQTLQFYLDVVRRNGYALKHVPNHFRSREICIAAVQDTGFALEWVPEDLCNRAPEICLAALRQHGFALEHVPRHLQTLELCLIAIQTDGNALRWVPEDLCSGANASQIYMTAVQRAGHTLNLIPINRRTIELCTAAIRKDGRALEFVPRDLLTFELCLVAVRQDGRALEWVPVELRTRELCSIAIRQNVYARRDVPGHIRAGMSEFQSEFSTITNNQHTGTSTLQSRDTVENYSVNLVDIVNNVKDNLDNHYSAALEWVRRVNAPAVIKYIDVQILALALQTLADKSFRDVAMLEILGDNECCSDRTLMSINKFYLAWKFHCVSNSSKNEKLEVLLSGARTIALRMAVAEALKFHTTKESTETFLFYEITLSAKLNLLTLATGMNHSGCAVTLSNERLMSIINDTYLKIAAEHPLLDEFLDDDAVAEIKATREFYDAKFGVHIENAAGDAKDSQYVRMMHCYRDMVNSEILEIKMQWLTRNLA
jgi:hypothetical protein